MPEKSQKQDPAPAPRGTPRRLITLSLGAGVLLAALALLWLDHMGTKISIHLVLALTLMIVVTMGLTGGLMALLFHSSRSGHDDEADEPGPRPFRE